MYTVRTSQDISFYGFSIHLSVDYCLPVNAHPSLRVTHVRDKIKRQEILMFNVAIANKSIVLESLHLFYLVYT